MHCNYFVNVNSYSFGNNEKKMPQIKSFLELLKDQFEDVTLKILLVAATLTLFIGFF